MDHAQRRSVIDEPEPAWPTMALHPVVMRWPGLTLPPRIVWCALWTAAGCRSARVRLRLSALAGELGLAAGTLRGHLLRLRAEGLLVLLTDRIAEDLVLEVRAPEAVPEVDAPRVLPAQPDPQPLLWQEAPELRLADPERDPARNTAPDTDGIPYGIPNTARDTVRNTARDTAPNTAPNTAPPEPPPGEPGGEGLAPARAVSVRLNRTYVRTDGTEADGTDVPPATAAEVAAAREVAMAARPRISKQLDAADKRLLVCAAILAARQQAVWYDAALRQLARQGAEIRRPVGFLRVVWARSWWDADARSPPAIDAGDRRVIPAFDGVCAALKVRTLEKVPP